MFLKKRRHAQMMGLLKHHSNGGGENQDINDGPLTPPSSGPDDDSECDESGDHQLPLFTAGDATAAKLRKSSESSVDSGVASEVSLVY